MLIYVLAVSTAIMAVIVCILSMSNVKLWIELRSMQKSTHQIVMPSLAAEAAFGAVGEEERKSVEQAFSEYKGIN